MAFFDAKALTIGDVNVPIPIVQGGMGVGISIAGLASAVSNAGGLGVISAAGMDLLYQSQGRKDIESNAQAVREEIRRARAMTQGPLGINIMVALSDYAQVVKAAVEEGIDVIFSGAGLPLSLPELAKGSKTKLVPIISSAKAAKTIARWWQDKHQYVPDAFVLEGPLAGGHLGFKVDQLEDPAFSLEALLPQVLAVRDTLINAWGQRPPIIVGGGIFHGSEMKAFLKRGADAVQMATRFVATEECDADPAFKQAYVDCRAEDIVITQSPVGLPGRAIGNTFLAAVKRGEKHPTHCPFHCISTCKQEESPYCISLALLSACKGRLHQGFAFIGAKGHLVKEVVSVAQLFETLAAEYALADV